MTTLQTVNENDAMEGEGEEEGLSDGEDEGQDEDRALLGNLQDGVPISRTLKRLLKRFGKGFGSGIGIYCGVRLVTLLMRNPFRQKLPKMELIPFLKDCARFAAFMGLYPSLYDLALEQLERRRGKKDDWNSGLAGGLAGLAMVIEDRTRRRVYCLFTMARAIGALISTLVKREKIPKVPYSETLLFCSCTSFLVYCNALKPQYLFPGYYRSVLKWSRDYTDRKLDTLFRQPCDRFLTCQEVGLHNDNCTRHAAKDFIQSIPGFAKLYLPIHMSPIILFRYKQFKRRPKRVIVALLKNIVWSSAFLATMVMLAKYVICLLRNVQHHPPPLSPWIPAAAGFVAGFGVLFERVNRRKELSLFLIPHTLYAVYLLGTETKLIRHIPYSSVVLFALSMVPIMHAYEREPDSLSLLLHATLKYFVGSRQTTVERRRLRRISEMGT